MIQTKTSRLYPVEDDRSRLVLWALRLLFVSGVLATLVLSLLPAREMPSVTNDKFEHFMAYASLGIVGGLLTRTRPARLALVLFLFLLAVALEIAQEFSPGRSTELNDALAGWAGACMAFLPPLLMRIFRRG
jgi:VanZ family protein